MIVIGIDENGLGPLLGPMVVTGVAFEVEDYDRQVLWDHLDREFIANDSKEIFSPKKLDAAELATQKWLKAFGHDAHLYSDLAAQIVLETELPSPCAKDSLLCHPAEIKLPKWSNTVLDEMCSRTPFACAKPLGIAAHSLCPGTFNLACDRPGMNKFRLDLELMMSIVRHFRNKHEGEILAICGKIGSTKKYENWLIGAGHPLITVIEEERAISTYRLSGLGAVSFVRDADGSHLPVAVASMIGKYLRELAMTQINLFLGDPGDRPASGYRDNITKAFVEQTAEKRQEIGIDDVCFLRNS